MAVCFLVYLVLLPIVVEKFVPTASQPIEQTLFVGIWIVCVTEIVVVLAIRNRKLPVPEEIVLQKDASRAAGKWLTIQIVSYAIAISVALYGVVLRVTGASLAKAMPFYIIALVLLVVWWPRKSSG